MKSIVILIATGLIFTAAGQSTSTDSKSTDNKKPAAPKVTKVPDSPTIPADATPVGDGSFRYVDKDGKKWIYRATPFGVSKSEEHPPVQVVQQVADDPTKSEDAGESVKFTRPTPFGAKVWTRKKSELDSYEKGIWDRDRLKTTNSSPAASSDAKPHPVEK